MIAYFGPTRLTNRPHTTPKFGPGKYKYKVDYYIQVYFTRKIDSYKKTGRSRSRSNIFF